MKVLKSSQGTRPRRKAKSNTKFNVPQSTQTLIGFQGRPVDYRSRHNLPGVPQLEKLVSKLGQMSLTTKKFREKSKTRTPCDQPKSPSPKKSKKRSTFDIEDEEPEPILNRYLQETEDESILTQLNTHGQLMTEENKRSLIYSLSMPFNDGKYLSTSQSQQDREKIIRETGVSYFTLDTTKWLTPTATWDEIKKTPVEKVDVHSYFASKQQTAFKDQRKEREQPKQFRGSRVRKRVNTPDKVNAAKKVVKDSKMLMDSEMFKVPEKVKDHETIIASTTVNVSENTDSMNNPVVATPQSPIDEVSVDLMSTKVDLRPVIIDGSNVAFAYGVNTFFDAMGIRLAVNYFSALGCNKILVVIPRERMSNLETKGIEILHQLKRDGRLMESWSKKNTNSEKLYSSYDDRLVLQLAEEENGIVITNDKFRDLETENPGWLKIVKKRAVGFQFASGHPYDIFIPCAREDQDIHDLLRYETAREPQG